jgi:regulator of RNase E activity RraA
MASASWYTDDRTVQLLRHVSTATLTTQLFKRGLRTRFMEGVVPLRAGTRMVGPARTLRYVPMREDLDTLDTLGARDNAQRALIETVNAGEVLVIDGLGSVGAGSLGSILALRLEVRGAAGIVTDGAYRDTPGIRRLDIPAYAAGQNANTNLTIYHPADFDTVIGCGGVLVEPGDAVVGDDEGVVVIPAGIATEVAQDAFEQDLSERYIFDLVKEGASVFDVYPMNAATARAYAAWRRSKGGAIASEVRGTPVASDPSDD